MIINPFDHDGQLEPWATSDDDEETSRGFLNIVLGRYWL
jgi:hypothetical protein